MLCVTISAVSKQIASLETFLGIKLFLKMGRGVQLSDAGRTYWLKVSPALRAIETATFETRAGAGSTSVLTLSCVPTFFTRWLIPRLPQFRVEHPQITLSFSKHIAPLEPMPMSVDAAIRYNPAEAAGVVSEYLAGREFVVIASAALTRNGTQPLREPSDVLAHTLLHHEEAQAVWSQWAVTHGVPGNQLVAGPRLAQYSALIQAARCGLGIAFVPRVLVADELADGSLVTLFGETIAVEHGHYLCYRPDRMHMPAFVAFRDWLMKAGAAQSA